jgi:UPF0176 protein
MHVVIALYKFTNITDPYDVRRKLDIFCKGNGIYGMLILAHEGINGTVSSEEKASLLNLLTFLGTACGIHDIDYKTSTATEKPFYRIRIRIKKEVRFNS